MSGTSGGPISLIGKLNCAFDSKLHTYRTGKCALGSPLTRGTRAYTLPTCTRHNERGWK